MHSFIKVPVVSTFFGYCNLKAGSYVISVLSVVASILDICCRIKILYEFDMNKGDDKKLQEQQWIVNVVLLLLFVVQLIIALLLIYGIRTEKKKYVMTWVGVQVAFMPLNVLDLMTILKIFMHLDMPMFVILLGELAFVVFGLYCIIVVRSYAIKGFNYEIAGTTIA
ncbi:unnamed protein product [Meganyctiphanes norvegica]|uniref:Uncharacterized protein n=1 Tax=Meganyctiphanes norvegica TaxID=48144 RepID=A0AAV2RQ53_MEGNR